jgi:biotin carboxyl carrier protein
MKCRILIEEDQFEVSLDGQKSATLNGRSMQIDISEVAPNSYSVLLDGHSFRIVLRCNGKDQNVFVGGSQLIGVVETEREALLKRYAQTRKRDSKRSEIRAPMPALVVRIEVNPGDQVLAGQGLIVLEAMKMENELRASHPGRVKEIDVEKGTAVEKNQLLMLLE